MFKLFHFFPKSKEKFWLTLDVGNEALKAAIFQNEKRESKILAKNLFYYERFGVLDGREFELDVLKKALATVLKECQKRTNIITDKVLLGLPPNLLRAKVFDLMIKRRTPQNPIDKKEEKELLDRIFQKNQKEIAGKFAEKKGILEKEIVFLSKRILQTKIDGYEVSKLIGFKGKDIYLKILTTFLPGDYLSNIERLFSSFNLKIVKIIHESEGLLNLTRKDQNSLFLDIGGSFTQIFLIKKGCLEQISDFESAGSNFSQAISQRLGLLKNESRDLKERYQHGLLAEEVRARLREIFQGEAEKWVRGLKQELKDEAFFEEIFLLGGTALLPEVAEVLEKNYNVIVKLFNLKYFLDSKELIKDENYVQYLPLLLLKYGLNYAS